MSSVNLTLSTCAVPQTFLRAKSNIYQYFKLHFCSYSTLFYLQFAQTIYPLTTTYHIIIISPIISLISQLNLLAILPKFHMFTEGVLLFFCFSRRGHDLNKIHKLKVTVEITIIISEIEITFFYSVVQTSPIFKAASTKAG